MITIELTSLIYTAGKITLYFFYLVGHAQIMSGWYARIPYGGTVLQHWANKRFIRLIEPTPLFLLRPLPPNQSTPPSPQPLQQPLQRQSTDTAIVSSNFPVNLLKPYSTDAVHLPNDAGDTIIIVSCQSYSLVNHRYSCPTDSRSTFAVIVAIFFNSIIAASAITIVVFIVVNRTAMIVSCHSYYSNNCHPTHRRDRNVLLM